MSKIASVSACSIAPLSVYAGNGDELASKAASQNECITSASQFHGVNSNVLRAILAIESGFHPGLITRNTNDSIDVEIAGTNSIHFEELSKFGIHPSNLQNACVGIYVAAWQIRKHIAKHGNTFEAIAKYHSSTQSTTSDTKFF